MNREAKRVPFICLQVQVSSSDGLAAGLAAGLGVGRRGVGGGPSRGGPASHIDQIPSSVKTLQILAGNSSMLKFGTHGTQPGVPIQAAVYKQRGNHRERERQPKQSINRKAIIYKWSCFHL